jgi:hypothetical protein
MRISRTIPLLVAGAMLAAAAPPAGAAPPAETGNCVSRFASVLGQAGVAGQVISTGARDPAFAPFGQVAVSPEAHATLGACPFNPEDFLPMP